MRRIAKCPWCHTPVLVDDKAWLNGTPELRRHMAECMFVPRGMTIRPALVDLTEEAVSARWSR